MTTVCKNQSVWCLAALSFGLLAGHAADAAPALELDTKDSKLTKIVILAGEPSSKDN